MTNAGPSDHLLTVREVAEFLDVAPITIYRMTREGTIPGAFRVLGSWRFDLEQLDRWTKTVEYRGLRNEAGGPRERAEFAINAAP